MDTGSVGIGTTSPAQKLHVIGSIYADSTPTSNASKTQYVSAGPGYSTAAGKYGVKVVSCDQADCQSGLGQDLAMVSGWTNWANNYNLSIAGGNNSSDVGKISFVTHKVNSTTYRYLGGFLDNAGTIAFNVQGNALFTGSVGIGTNNPTQKLHVTGTIYSSVAQGTAPLKVDSSTLVSNLNVDYLDNKHATDFYWLGRNLNHVDTSTSWNGVLPINAFAFRHGKPAFDDPDFRTSSSGVGYYGRGQSQGSVTRMTDASAAAADSAYIPSGNSSGYVVKIADTSVTANNIGGFVQAVTSGQNKVWVQVFRAFLPVGATLSPAANSMGTGSKQTWLTSNVGTGKWEWYALLSINGNGGSYSTFGHMSAFLTGGTTSNVWYLSYCNSYELTNGEYDGLRTKFADSAYTISSWAESSGNEYRYVWHSWSDNTAKLAYKSSFMFCPNTGDLKVTSLNANDSAGYTKIYPGYIQIRKNTAANPTANYASIEFSYGSGQNVYIGYTPNDSYRAPAGLKVFGGSDATPAWFEVEGQIISSVATGTAPFVVTSTTKVANLYADKADTATILLTNNTSQAADDCYSESPGLRFWRYNGTSSTTGQTGGDGWILSWSWNPGSVGGQIYVDDNPTKTICIRGRNNDADKTFTTWAKILHSDNYTSYTVTKTGGGASGTWGINITGNAATATTATNVTGIVAIANGGTGASTAAGARANLGTWALVSDSYNTLMPADGTTNGWVKIGKSNTSYGILPSASGGAGSGHNYIGTSSWYWKYAYIDDVYFTTLNINNKLVIDSTGRIIPYSTSTRNAGNYGYYDSTLLGHVWSIGTSYSISADGKSPNNLYGLAYFHTNWSNGSNNDGSKTAKGTYAGGHQVAWFNNGVLASSIGDNIYTKGQFISKKAQGTAPLVVDSSTQVTNLKSNFAQYADVLRDPVYYTSGSRRSSGNITFADGGLHYFLATSSMSAANGKPASDGHILHMAWDNSKYDAQLTLPTSATGAMQWRVQTNGTDASWSPWKTVIDSSNYSSYLGYIGTTAVQASSANQALTGISSINGRLTIGANSDLTSIGFGGIHNVEFGEAGYAHREYYFRPSYGANGVTYASLNIQNASAAASPTFTTTHRLDANGNAYHSGNIYLDTGDSDRFIQFRYNTNNYAGASWRLLSRGSGSGDANYFDIETGGSSAGTNTWYRALRLTMDNRYVGLSVDAPTQKLHVGGNARFDGGIGSKGTNGNVTGSYVAHPGGGVYATSTSSVTGYLKITLPQKGKNTMMSFDVTIYTYDGANQSYTTYHISGYEYSTNGWYNPVTKVYSEGIGPYTNLTVRLGNDGTYACVTIGEANTVWTYPQVTVHNIMTGYSGCDVDTWIGGWAVGFTTTALTTVVSEKTAVNTQNINVSGNASSATNADTVDGKHASEFATSDHTHSTYVKYGGNQTSIGSGSPVNGAQTWCTSTNLPYGNALIYNSSGAEYSMLYSFRPSDLAYGAILRWGYTDKYLYITRKANNSWTDGSTNWAKIYAGYADSAGSATNATSAEYLNNYSISNPNTDAIKDNKVKWFAAISSTVGGSAGYAGNNYGFPVSNNANGILYLGTHPGKYGHQLGFSSNGNIYHRYQNGSDFPSTANGGSWSTILTSDNAGSYVVTLTTDQEISGAKTFQNGKWIIKASESNEITTQTWTASTYYKFDDSAVVNSLSATTNSIKFRWYNDYWNIGIIRGSSSESYGFAIGLQNSAHTHLLDAFRVNKDGKGYLKGVEILTKPTQGTTVAMANASGTITVETNKIIPVTTTGTSAVTFNFTWNSPAACDEAHVIITGSGSSKTITIGNVNSDSTNTKKNNTAIKVTSGGYGEISILYFDSKYFIRAVGN
jgi:hypothetical protein